MSGEMSGEMKGDVRGPIRASSAARGHVCAHRVREREAPRELGLVPPQVVQILELRQAARGPRVVALKSACALLEAASSLPGRSSADAARSIRTRADRDFSADAAAKRLSLLRTLTDLPECEMSEREVRSSPTWRRIVSALRQRRPR